MEKVKEHQMGVLMVRSMVNQKAFLMGHLMARLMDCSLVD